jgi:hypothetical protein
MNFGETAQLGERETYVGGQRRVLSVWSIAALGLVVSVGFLLAPASALAAGSHVFEGSFGSAGSGDGQLELGEHSGIAVNEATHDVYAADTGNHRVDQFDSIGTFLRAFGAPTFIAVDNSAAISAASAAGTMHVEIEGSGEGEVSSVGGFEVGEGTPPIECSGPPATGTCEIEVSFEIGTPPPPLSASAPTKARPPAATR